jgi:hypothetical protein
MMDEKFETNNESAETKQKYFKSRSLAGRLFSLGVLAGAIVIVFILVNNRLSASTANEAGNWTGGGGSCCSVEAAANGQDSLALSALDYYKTNFGDIEGLEAIVEDFGCHQEITLSRSGEVVRRLSHTNGNFSDITL